MDKEAIRKIGLCVICGIKPDTKAFNNGTEKLSEKGMCSVCDHLADEKFYEIPNYLLAIKYFREYLRKVPDRSQREDLKQVFTERPTTEWIHGIMPSRCPFCKNLATNQGQIQSYKIGTPQHTKVILNKELPSLVCKACGDFSLYLSHVYGFSRDDSVKTLRYVCAIKEANEKAGKLVCETCACEVGFKDPEYTDEEKEFVKKTGKKILCKECIIRLKENAKRTKSSVQTNK